MRIIHSIFMVLLYLVSDSWSLSASEKTTEKLSFEHDVLPALERACLRCHSVRLAKPKGKLILDDKEAIITAMRDDNLIVPGKPSDSELYRRIILSADDDDVMPPSSATVQPVSAADQQRIYAWIAAGADFADWTHVVDKRRDPSGLITGQGKPSITSAAQTIDTLIERDLRAGGIQRNAPIDEATFVRRVYLDIVGRIPTVNELRTFISSRDTQKRDALVNNLLNSPGYVSHNFNYWADVLRASTDQIANTSNAWLHYIKTSLRENKPYNVWVHEMLAASGDVWEDPAVGYYFRDEKNRLANYEATTAIFLGTQIGCAQCHNHPYDVWTRKDYFSMYAYRAAVYHYWGNDAGFTTLKRSEVQASFNKLNEETKGGDRQERRRWLNAYLAVNGKHGLRKHLTKTDKHYYGKLPDDYQYDDGKPKQVVQPTPLFGEIPPLEKGDKPADVFADWLTAPENPKFTLVIANRMWHKLLGQGVVGEPTQTIPIDQAQNPNLATYLAQLMVDVDYDLRYFQRIIMATTTYQSAASPEDRAAEELAHFPGPILRRMTAEQLWDSLMTLIDAEIDTKISDKAPDFSFLFALRDAPTLEAFWAVIDDEVTHKRNSLNYNNVTDLDRSLKGCGFNDNELVRASQMRSPATPSHFLQQFGQAERELIEDAWQNPTIPQVLTQLNGPLFAKITEPTTSLMNMIAKAKTNDEKVTIIFQALLARDPSSHDRAVCQAAFTAGQTEKDLIWAILNMRQFLFQY